MLVKLRLVVIVWLVKVGMFMVVVSVVIMVVGLVVRFVGSCSGRVNVGSVIVIVDVLEW